MEGNGADTSATADTARELKARRFRIVEAPSGLSYKVRKLSTEEVLTIRGGIPDLSAMPLTEEEAEITAARRSAAQSVRDLRIAQEFVKVALVEPAVGEGEGQIAIEDVPLDDMMALSAAVSDLSGIGRGAAARIRPTREIAGAA